MDENANFEQDGRPRPTLVLPMGTGGGGFLTIPYFVAQQGWHRYPVQFSPAKVSLLLALRNAYEDDCGEPEQMRGWRHPNVLAQMIGHQTTWQPEVHTVRANMVKIEQLLRTAAKAVRKKSPEAELPPAIIERQRGFGARLALPFDVKDLTE
ncbi:MAG: hypothetical protein HUU20_16490 [Pirellulales bacterium]|nr:hypothetical protein [Pirellulales bacterium]